jgi:hypothetical protein
LTVVNLAFLGVDKTSGLRSIQTVASLSNYSYNLF